MTLSDMPSSPEIRARKARSKRVRLAAAGLLVTAGTWAPQASAHDTDPPIAAEQPLARWPHDRPSAHDVLVPVVLVIGATGEVTSAAVEASLNSEFDAAALEAARRWTFQPALEKGKPVPAKIHALVRFVAPPADVPVTAADFPVKAATTVESTKAIAPSNAPRIPAAEVSVSKPQAPPVTVTVVGDRAPLPPRSASEVTQDKRILSAAPHRTGSDMLQSVPGIAITQHSGEGAAHQIFFRGFDAVHGQDLEIWAGKAHIGVGQTGLARRPLPYGEMAHDVHIVDASAKVRLEEVELGVSAYNIMNLDWYDGEYTFASNFQRGAAPSLVPQRHVTVGAPRTVLWTLSLFL